ncbi:MAG: GNAT family N-acetyltransferase [Desulfobacterales bacterium]|nr:GNAT family N-acetyltransferase [Desulfobacterales bacterium]
MNRTFYKIRNATINDVSDISELSNQLGYPSSEAEIKERLDSVLNSDDHAIFVAYQPDQKVIAWIHVYKRQSVESGFFAEIGGFIVSEAFRSKGIGKHLLKAVENWTIQKNLPKLRVRSQIKREDAKRFYSNMGFSVSKKQRVFDKMMNMEV